MAKKKIVIVGNCQARPIATLLEEMSDEVDVTKVAIVHLLKSEQELEYAPFFEEADYIIAQLVNDRYPCSFVRTKTLEGKYKDKVIKIVNIYSKKYFNNWINLKRGEINLVGPLDTYHNEVIYDCWKQKKDIAFTLKRFFECSNIDLDSLEELRKRESNADIAISDYLYQDYNNFHTFNHPKNHVIEFYVNRILSLLELNIKKESVNKNEFLGRVSIPEVEFYDDRTLFHGYEFEISENKTTRKKIYSPQELIRSFFCLYDETPPGQCIENKNGIHLENNVITIEDQKFLHQKNNGQRQIEHLMGNLLISEEAKSTFKENIKNNVDLASKYNFKYKHIIFPAKPFVYRDMFKLKGINIHSLYTDDIRGDDIIYPNLDKSDYDSEDTHTNDKGVIKIIKRVLNDFGYDYNFDVSYSLSQKKCDLALMLGKDKSTYLKSDIIAINGEESKSIHIKQYTLDGSLSSNTGDLCYLTNLCPPVKKTIFLFGDSFFKTRLHLFSAIFEDVIYIRNPFVIEDLVKTVNPDIVLTGNAERYLVNPPSSSIPRPYFMNYLSHGFKSKPSKDVISAFEALFSGRYSKQFLNFKNKLKVGLDYVEKEEETIKIERNVYDRQDESNNSSDFGQSCSVVSMDETDNQYPYVLEKVNTYGEVTNEKSKFCNEIQGVISQKLYQLENCDVFLPNGAVFIPGTNELLKPSLWQSQLFFNSVFRNDKSTKWEWKVRKDYKVKKLYGRTLLLHNRSYKNYFHWLIDIVSKIHLVNDMPSYDHIIIGLSKEHPYVDYFLKKYMIDIEKIIWTDGYEVYRCESLTAPYYKVTENIGIRANYREKEHYKGWCVNFLNEIKEKFTKNIIASHNNPRKIFVSRRFDNSRKILNIDEVSDLMTKLGFVEINPGELALEKQIEIFNSATDIVAVHGAALTNIIWSDEKISLTELMPNDYDDPGYRMLAGLKKIKNYSVVFCEAYNPNNTVFSDLIVDIDELERLLTHK